MGLLDGLLGNVLGSVLGGGGNDPKAALIQGVLGMLVNKGAGDGGAAAGGLGGLGGLVEAFGKAGMGEQMGSWIGTGQNMPISADQLSQVLGSLGGATGGASAGGLGDILGQLAGSAGVSREDAAGQLSELLPNIIDKMTPNGQLPSGDMGGMDLGGLMAQMLGKK